ncbi:MAG: T9SS type A sorting domain-containing protein [Saprospiraceae bacterium]|nr:T9SS type A sorting domain-containing protein [Saprospiraceae bacterium]
MEEINFWDLTYTALPITLSEFKAVWNSGGWVDLKWTTVSEIGSDKFLVERSKDGRKWETIGTESARGAQDIRMDYFLKDLTPYTGINYYRLKMFDLDGSFKYSPIAAVMVENEGMFAKLYPNPAPDFAMIDLEAGLTLEEISLYNLQGKLIKHQTFTEASQYRVELADIVQGEYFMEIVLSDKQIFTKKLILTGSRN